MRLNLRNFSRQRRRHRVAVFAPLDPSISGGVAQYVLGLAQGLEQVDTSDFDFIWVVNKHCSEWIAPTLSSSCDVIEIDHPMGFVTAAPPIDRSVALVHFPYQVGFLTEKPSIYQPHDLQHEHFPDFFSSAELAARRFAYPALIQQSKRVIVGSSFTALDVSARYGTEPNKIDVVPFGIPHSVVQSTQATRNFLPDSEYLLYPAASWPHKNHENLFAALRLLREHHGLPIRLVLPGSTSGSVDLRELARAYRISDLVELPGFLSDGEIAHLYENARGVVVPSHFENASFPIWEAMRAGIPVAASTVTSLPKQVGDAGLLFDQNDPVSIASAVERIWRDEDLRLELRARGVRRIQHLSWSMTARGILRSYRLALGLPLRSADHLYEQEKFDL